MKQGLKDFLWLTLGTLFVAVGVYFFKFPNHFSTGGVTGLSVILAPFVPLSQSNLVTLFNIIFLILGFLVLNRGFGVRTVYCSLLFSGMLELFAWLVPLSAPLTDQKMLELFFAVIFPALGSAILFNAQASTGGTDILAMMLQRFSSLDIGKALLCTDLMITAATLFLFGIETGLYSILGLVIKSVMVDSVIESLNRRKSITVITSQPQLAEDYITHTLHRGATVWQATGAYTGETHTVILTALSRPQAVALRRYLKQHDPAAFVLITNSSEIFGKGFLRA